MSNADPQLAIGMNERMETLLGHGMKIDYDYDMGDTTPLSLFVPNATKRGKSGAARLAQNSTIALMKKTIFPSPTRRAQGSVVTPGS
ncbi:MAG: hypothetical protein QNK24_02265 [Desulfuromusa sp.]|nr:hypothetical protein [Desulfuromusa sp.]